MLPLDRHRQPRVRGTHQTTVTQLEDIPSLAAIRRLTSDGKFISQTSCIEIALLFARISATCNRMNPASMEIIYSFDHYTESWVEVSSQPSSSSLSSATADDALPTGLRGQLDPNTRRRRRLTRNELPPFTAPARATSAAGSSQEEYEESESESDQIMTSSNEALRPRFPIDVRPPTVISSASEGASSDADEDDDENSTALGISVHEPAFTPQPNAFSHPPRSNPARFTGSPEAPSSYFSSPRGAPPRSATRSHPPHRTRSHTPYNMISPSHQPDHDAALRASLSTLLSCAAAARGLPKRDQPSQHTTRPSDPREPLTLRVVPESGMTGEHATGRRAPPRRNSTSSSRLQSPEDKGKRKASRSKDRHDTRKKRRGGGEEVLVAPTLMTWVVSAGVVVLFSAISFSAGYAIGREVGRMEAGASAGSGFGGKDVGRELKRLRWGSTSTMARA